MSKGPQILIDSEIIRAYCIGTDGDRDLIEKLYPGIFGGLKSTVFLNMIREYKTHSKSSWLFTDVERQVELHIQIIVEEKPMGKWGNGNDIIQSV